MRSYREHLFPLLIALFVTSTAWADLSISHSKECARKDPGAACVNRRGKPGICQQVPCGEYDSYIHEPPESSQDCIQCITPEEAPRAAQAVASRRQQNLVASGLLLGIAIMVVLGGGNWLVSRWKRR
jgi:hypothetical protein